MLCDGATKNLTSVATDFIVALYRIHAIPSFTMSFALRIQRPEELFSELSALI